MSVYVGASEWPFGRMMMAHLTADTTEEQAKGLVLTGHWHSKAFPCAEKLREHSNKLEGQD